MPGTMHLTPLDEAIYRYVEEEPWEGHVQIGEGAFVGVHITREDAARWAAEVELAVNLDVSAGSLVGYWTVLEDNYGFLYVTRWNTRDEYEARLTALRAAYEAEGSDDEAEGADYSI